MCSQSQYVFAFSVAQVPRDRTCQKTVICCLGCSVDALEAPGLLCLREKVAHDPESFYCTLILSLVNTCSLTVTQSLTPQLYL